MHLCCSANSPLCGILWCCLEFRNFPFLLLMSVPALWFMESLWAAGNNILSLFLNYWFSSKQRGPALCFMCGVQCCSCYDMNGWVLAWAGIKVVAWLARYSGQVSIGDVSAGTELVRSQQEQLGVNLRFSFQSPQVLDSITPYLKVHRNTAKFIKRQPC